MSLFRILIIFWTIPDTRVKLDDSNNYFGFFFTWMQINCRCYCYLLIICTMNTKYLWLIPESEMIILYPSPMQIYYSLQYNIFSDEENWVSNIYRKLFFSLNIKRRKRDESMEHFPHVLINASEFIKGE